MSKSTATEKINDFLEIKWIFINFVRFFKKVY